jgi:flavin-dependent dehydrogenase
MAKIVIVGAGISGLAIASMLGGIHAEVFLLDQATPLGRRPPFAGIVTERDVRALDISIDSSVGHRITNVSQVRVDGSLGGQLISTPDWWAIERSTFTEVLASAVAARGISIVPDATVTGFVRNHVGVSGVRCDGDGRVFPADLVVLADDADPRLAEQLGLRPDWLPTEIMHLGKQRYDAPPAFVRERFGTASGEFRVVAFRQQASWGSPGYGIVIPVEDGFTLTVAMLLEDEMVHERHISEFRDEIIAFAAIQELIGGAAASTFVTEVVPVGGFDAKPVFHAGHVLVASDLVGVTSPVNRDGLSANLVMCSAAARTLGEAVYDGIFSRDQLSAYSRRLAEEVIAPVNAARRTDRSLRSRPPWQWAAKSDLVPAIGGVTAAGKSETLPEGRDSGVFRRLRRFGRSPGIHRHAPGEYDE